MELTVVNNSFSGINIKLQYLQVINKNCMSDFAKKAFRDSYQEFLIQVQSFDTEGKFITWEELKKQFPKANLNLNYKTAFSIGLYLKDLKNIIPDLTDNLGRHIIPFQNNHFEIISSSTKDINMHCIGITYETDWVGLKSIIGDYLIIQLNSETQNTLTLKMQPNLSISSWNNNLKFTS